MNYIYCYKNKINGHKYIGQTNNLKVRYSAHKSQSYNPNSKDYNCLFHKKIREYGLENFDFYVLEEIQNMDSEYVDFRESYWIEKENSWARYGKGYNENTGGKQYKKSLTLSDKEIEEIKKLIKTTNLTFTEISKKYNTYRDFIRRINLGWYGFNENEKYPLRITRNWREIPQDIKYEIALLLRDTKIPYKEIMIKYGVSEHFLSNLNTGKDNFDSKDFTYPIRKSNQRLTDEQEKIIKEGLLNKEKIKDIALKANVNRSTVSNRKKQYNF